ncbi:histidine kinase [Undibacterium sp. B2R-29]|nr:histidine kinase [Undibacterium crateris]
MKLRHKFILLAVIPLLLSLAGMAVTVLYHATALAKQQRLTVEQAYLHSKEAELNHYVNLGKAAIRQLYDSNAPHAQDDAKRILKALEFGKDGYFYIYDMQGRNLMHPRQPELIGQNLWDLADSDGNYTIRNLISAAKHGGGPVRYLWKKPSTDQMVPKLGYVIPLEKWGWMLGTGIYLDDVEDALHKIDVQVEKNIHTTLLSIAAIALFFSILAALFGLAININESRVAEAKLKVLAHSVVRSQEDERARLSRDLHDGLSQLLVSTKLQVESGIAKIKAGATTGQTAEVSLERAVSQLNEALSEVRRISHDLRPALLDDLGLIAAFEHLCEEFENATGLPVHCHFSGDMQNLSEISNTSLFRVAQEALTNIHKHAQKVNSVEMELTADKHYVRLKIADNGNGFDLQGITNHPKRGIGISNMRERLATVGGHLSIESDTTGTRVIAQIPNGDL